MSVLSRFKDILESNINGLLDKAENPEKMIEQCLRNLNDDLANVQSETAGIMVDEQRAKRDVQECTDEISKMQDYAVKALQAGNEDDAKKFLESKALHTSKLAALQATYNLSKDSANKMREMYNKLTSDIQELEGRKEVIKGKLSLAKAQERMNKMTSSIGDSNDSIDAFDRLEEKADKALDKARAVAELNNGPDNSIKNLTAKYSAPSTNVDAELEALKASLEK